MKEHFLNKTKIWFSHTHLNFLLPIKKLCSWAIIVEKFDDSLFQRKYYPNDIGTLLSQSPLKTKKCIWVIEAAVQRCSVKKVFLKISQYSQDKTCPGVSFLSKLQAWGLQLYWKRLSHRCFPMNFAIFLRTPFYIKHLWWLLLKLLFNYISIISST